jgi:hypothetical protein
MKVAFIVALLAAFAGGFAAAQQTELLGPLNTGVNTLLQAAGVGNSASSRVVPIVTPGGTLTGYAQVVGTPSAVNATKAVVQLHTEYGGAWSISALVPVSSVARTSGAMHRVSGAAIDAVISTRL